MEVRCMCCGSTAQVKEEKIEYSETGVRIICNCGCGARFIKVYDFIADFKLSNKKFEETT